MNSENYKANDLHMLLLDFSDKTDLKGYSNFWYSNWFDTHYQSLTTVLIHNKTQLEKLDFNNTPIIILTEY